MTQDIRWKQRFQHFSSSLAWLEKAVNRTDLDVIGQAGAIQFFEICFELSWKLLKDYLEYEGYTDVASPRAAIKQAFNIGLLTDGHEWLQLLNDRNMTSHVYDEETAKNIYRLICSKYYPMFLSLKNTFDKQDTDNE